MLVRNTPFLKSGINKFSSTIQRQLILIVLNIDEPLQQPSGQQASDVTVLADAGMLLPHDPSLRRTEWISKEGDYRSHTLSALHVLSFVLDSQVTTCDKQILYNFHPSPCCELQRVLIKADQLWWPLWKVAQFSSYMSAEPLTGCSRSYFYPGINILYQFQKTSIVKHAGDISLENIYA